VAKFRIKQSVFMFSGFENEKTRLIGGRVRGLIPFEDASSLVLLKCLSTSGSLAGMAREPFLRRWATDANFSPFSFASRSFKRFALSKGRIWNPPI
jgi:hypothetical protein